MYLAFSGGPLNWKQKQNLGKFLVLMISWILGADCYRTYWLDSWTATRDSHLASWVVYRR